MPAKLDRCIRKVRRSGKDKSSAYAICSSSTGIKRKKGGGWTKGNEPSESFGQMANRFIELLSEGLDTLTPK